MKCIVMTLNTCAFVLLVLLEEIHDFVTDRTGMVYSVDCDDCAISGFSERNKIKAKMRITRKVR